MGGFWFARVRTERCRCPRWLIDHIASRFVERISFEVRSGSLEDRVDSVRLELSMRGEPCVGANGPRCPDMPRPERQCLCQLAPMGLDLRRKEHREGRGSFGV
jgi:hypothetical protein